MELVVPGDCCCSKDEPRLVDSGDESCEGLSWVVGSVLLETAPNLLSKLTETVVESAVIPASASIVVVEMASSSRG